MVFTSPKTRCKHPIYIADSRGTVAKQTNVETEGLGLYDPYP